MTPTPDSDFAHRQVYVLSLWRETPEAPWRAALRPSGSSERIGFADLEALALFLLCLDDGRERVVVAGELSRGYRQEPIG